MFDIKNYFKMRTEIDEGCENESFGYLLFQGSIYAATNRFDKMTQAQTEACLEILVDLGLVKFVNAGITRQSSSRK